MTTLLRMRSASIDNAPGMIGPAVATSNDIPLGAVAVGTRMAEIMTPLGALKALAGKHPVFTNVVFARPAASSPSYGGAWATVDLNWFVGESYAWFGAQTAEKLAFSVAPVSLMVPSGATKTAQATAVQLGVPPVFCSGSTRGALQAPAPP